MLYVVLIAFGVPLLLAGIATLARRRRQGFYSETVAGDPSSVDARLSRWANQGGKAAGGGFEDDIFNRKYR
jgi:hypothetical protein